MGAFEDLARPTNPNRGRYAKNDALTETGPARYVHDRPVPPSHRDRGVGGRHSLRDVHPAAARDRGTLEMVATLEDVAPNGTATSTTTSARQGSLRAVDPGRSWQVGGAARRARARRRNL
jgi:hypothetical protein